MCEYRVEGCKIILERVVVYGPCDTVEWSARVHLPEPWRCDVGYGATEREAVSALMARASVQAFKMAVKNREMKLMGMLRDVDRADDFFKKYNKQQTGEE